MKFSKLPFAAPEAPASAAHDDLELFRQAVADVQPRAGSGRVLRRPLPPSVRPRQSEHDERCVLDELLDGPDPESFECGETLTFRGDGIQDSVWRKLRRGAYRLDGELDLHGLSRERAREAVLHFLACCRDREWRCVRVVHGKGNGSPNSGPVLKRALDGWLRRRRDVLAFCSAKPEDGGTGAVYVLLRRRI